jgi:hypothetical protein
VAKLMFVVKPTASPIHSTIQTKFYDSLLLTFGLLFFTVYFCVPLNPIIAIILKSGWLESYDVYLSAQLSLQINEVLDEQ